MNLFLSSCKSSASEGKRHFQEKLFPFNLDEGTGNGPWGFIASWTSFLFMFCFLLQIGLEVILVKNLAVFCPYTENLSESEFKSNKECIL